MHALQFRFVAGCGLLIAACGLAGFARPGQSPELTESKELNSQVIKLFGEGKYKEALPVAKRALELREKALGPTHADLIPLLINLGELYNVTKHAAQARSSFEQALTIAEQSYGKDDPKVAHILDKVGLASYENRQEKDAEGFFLRSIEIREK